jgi:hypothetical protein
MDKVYLAAKSLSAARPKTDECAGEMVFVVFMLSIQKLMEVIEFIGENSLAKA